MSQTEMTPPKKLQRNAKALFMGVLITAHIRKNVLIPNNSK